MSSCDIKELRTLTLSSDRGCFNDSSFIAKIDHLLHNISIGVSTTEDERRELQFILGVIKNLSYGRLSGALDRVYEKIWEDRRAVAGDFVVAHGGKLALLNGMNFDEEVMIRNIYLGTELYQWCTHVLSGGEATLYDSRRDTCTVGEFFADSRVDLEALGLAPSSDLNSASGHYRGSAQRVLYKFRFPFAARALVSFAESTVDTWSSHHYFDGTIVGKGDGVWAKGGARQFYIPLTKEQRIELAKVAQMV